MSMPDDPRGLARAVRQHVKTLALWGITEVPFAVSGTSRRSEPDTAAALSRLEQQVKTCTRCPLYRTATRHVFGEGDPEARLVFVGEAPGRDEDLQGRPFVGAAGRLLTKMIEAMGLTREAVYICNVLKHRPPANRVPQPDEVDACQGHLVEQLEIIRPAIICTLGAVAARTLLGPGVSVMKARGRLTEYHGIPLMPTLHPAYLLRNPDAKRLVWQDLKRVKKLLSDQRPET